MRQTTQDDDTLAWIEFSLRWAGAQNRPKLARLLENVKSEILFEIEAPYTLESLKRAETG